MITIEIIKAATLICHGFLLGWILAYFEPLQELIRIITKRLSDKYFVVFYLKTAVSCFKCLSFWSTLILTTNLYYAIAASFFAFLTTKLLKI